MHPRNPYRDSPDFAALANEYQPLKPYVISTSPGHSTIDFKDPTSQRHLTEALLYRDFGISLCLPDDRLCPPVPNRLNYVLWIQDIMRATSCDQSFSVQGIDIGTGASAIYPLLACKLEPKWTFTTTDVDKTSLNSAQENVDRNGLHDRIKIVPATLDGPILLPLYLDSGAMFDFSMCNPPFYSSTEDVAQSAKAKEFGPYSVCTGADIEMITPGGESAFVSRMLEESLKTRTRCRWYTSMLGKMSSLSNLVAQLRQHSVENYGITDFIQGQTRRWAIAWSFDDIRLPDHISRITNPNPVLQSIMPPRNNFRQHYPSHKQSKQHLTQLIGMLTSMLSSIDGVSMSQQTKVEEITDSLFLHTPLFVQATHNTWSRSARRRNKHSESVATLSDSDSAVSLICRIGWIQPLRDGTILLEAQWIRGRDRSLFESFWSHLSRKVQTAISTVTS